MRIFAAVGSRDTNPARITQRGDKLAWNSKSGPWAQEGRKTIRTLFAAGRFDFPHHAGPQDLSAREKHLDRGAQGFPDFPFLSSHPLGFSGFVTTFGAGAWQDVTDGLKAQLLSMRSPLALGPPDVGTFRACARGGARPLRHAFGRRSGSIFAQRPHHDLKGVECLVRRSTHRSDGHGPWTLRKRGRIYCAPVGHG